MTPASMLTLLNTMLEAEVAIEAECKQTGKEIDTALRTCMALLNQYDARILANLQRGTALRIQIVDALQMFAELKKQQADVDDDPADDWKRGPQGD